MNSPKKSPELKLNSKNIPKQDKKPNVFDKDVPVSEIEKMQDYTQIMANSAIHIVKSNYLIGDKLHKIGEIIEQILIEVTDIRKNSDAIGLKNGTITPFEISEREKLEDDDDEDPEGGIDEPLTK